MKLFANKKLFKKIVILLVTITLVNALMPLHMVSADADEDFGGALFRPICDFIAGVGDLVISGLQWIFIGDTNIKTGEIPELNMSTYVIRYSPGVIFSNKVPGLDANFINPGSSDSAKELSGKAEPIGETWNIDDKRLLNYGFNYENMEAVHTNTEGNRVVFVKTGVDKANTIYRWSYTGDDKIERDYILFRQISDQDIMWDVSWLATNVISPILYSLAFLSSVIDENKTLLSGWKLYEIDTKANPIEGVVKESTAEQLQGTIAKWYKALRMVSLVALLSVLVYVGIRIIIASTGQEKAKYKRMIGDWLVAICILFVLNYIMAFTMEIVEQITKFFATSNLIDPVDGADKLMSGIRNNIVSQQYSGVTTFTYLLLYLTLVVYTVIFTIHYLKRLVYLAFFTMIAPLIAVTYPLDKIKDGQAQAFGTWIKEYTFNAAIPVIHIIIYSALVGSAADLAQSNPLYSIICISFLIPAEKFFRKLFGFEKASTTSQLGAAAGGAVIMNAINKMGAKSGKQAAEKAGASTPRTVSNGYAASIGVGDGGATGPAPAGPAPTGPAPAGPAPAGPTPAGPAPAGPAPAGPAPAGPVQSGSAQAGPASASPTPTGSAQAGLTQAGDAGTLRNANIYGPTMGKALGSTKGIRRGMAAVGRRFFNKNTAKSAGRLARKGLLGVAGAGLGATAGLVAGISTGDFSNALKYGAVGAGAGFSGANYAGDKLLAGEKSVRETFKEGAIGEDEYSNLKSDKEFYESEEFRRMVNNYDLELKDEKGNLITGKGRTAAMRNAVQTYRDNGITDTTKISTAIQLDLTPQEGAYAIRLAENIGRSGWNNKNVREDYEKRYRSQIPAGIRGDKIWDSMEYLL